MLSFNLADLNDPCQYSVILQKERKKGGDEGTHLDDSRAGGDGVVGDGVLAAGEDSVGLAGEALGDLDGEAALDGLGLDKGRAGNGDEGGVDGDALVALEGVVLNQKVSIIIKQPILDLLREARGTLSLRE